MDDPLRVEVDLVLDAAIAHVLPDEALASLEHPDVVRDVHHVVVLPA